jgi:hypothetical protein
MTALFLALFLSQTPPPVNGAGVARVPLTAPSFTGTAGYITLTKVAAPTSGTFALCTGTLTASTTYYYRVSAYNAVGETTAFTEVSKATSTTSATRGVSVVWAHSGSGATGFKIYGRSTGAEQLIATVGSGVRSYCDDGSLTPSGALPSKNLTGSSAIDGPLTLSGMNSATIGLNSSGNIEGANLYTNLGLIQDINPQQKTLLRGNVSGSTSPAVRIDSGGALTGSSNIVEFSHQPDSGVDASIDLNGQGTFNGGLAVGSSAGYKIGTSRLPLGSWTAHQTAALANNTYLEGPYATHKSINADYLTCSWEVAGTGGSTGLVMQLMNQTDNTEICSCTMSGTCSTAAHTAVFCNCGTDGTGTALTAGKLLMWRVKSTSDCATYPTNATCSAELHSP